MQPSPHRALTVAEIAGIVQDYRRAAERAMEAGFEGVELHGANGYLIDQFLQNGSNRRTDEYGGSIHNRTRFLIEVVEALISACGADRVAVRIGPERNLERNVGQRSDRAVLVCGRTIEPVRSWPGFTSLSRASAAAN